MQLKGVNKVYEMVIKHALNEDYICFGQWKTLAALQKFEKELVKHFNGYVMILMWDEDKRTVVKTYKAHNGKLVEECFRDITE